MRRSIHATAPALLAATLILAASVAGRQADDPPPAIKEIMGKLNKGPQALTSAIGRNLDKPEPDWETLESLGKDYLERVKELEKNIPPRGELASWKRLTKAYLEDTKSLNTAITSMDREAALEAHHKIQQACARCHVRHKP